MAGLQRQERPAATPRAQLELIRTPLNVRSASRSPEHNLVVAGGTRSKHMDGTTFDIALTKHDPHVFEGETECERKVQWTFVRPNA